MGLDIYLYPAADAAKSDQHYAEWNALYARRESGELTEEQFDLLVKDVTPYAPHADVPSERHPGHLFNRRYLRSSYNGGGFNRAVPDFLASDGGEDDNVRGSLYWIFGPMGREWDGDDGTLGPDDLPKLRECKARAESVAADLAKSDRLRVTRVGANQFSREWLEIDDTKALALVREKATQKAAQGNDGGGWWSSRDMDWFGGEIEVVAMVPGTEKRFFSADPWPVVHVVYRATGEGFESYVQSAEIVAEFCDEAIALIEKDGSARLSWSG